MNILLNWLPPALPSRPSPAMSILQSYLLYHGINSKVKYWNVLFMDLINKFVDSHEDDNDIDKLIPFLGNIAMERNDELALDKIANEFRSIYPQYINISRNYHINKIAEEANAIDRIFHDELIQLPIQDYELIGISSKFHQWLPGNILVKNIKTINLESKIVLGGLGSKKEAMSMMKNFPDYDFAIWGGGEFPLLQLCKYLQGEIDINDVPNLLHKSDGLIIASGYTNKHYLNLDSISPLYSDYFSQIKTKPIDSIEVQLEGGRGCHWNKCHFCFLNNGYKFRTKSSSTLTKEIEDIIDQYHTTRFVFVDNDIVGNDIERFNCLLDSLIEIHDLNSSFQVDNAEVITYGLNSDVIKKMALAGFKAVQIGYESISDNLLTKIEKKNSFASNLSFIKWALQFNIAIEGANLIPNLLEETEKDILLTSEYLHFLRFYLKQGQFKHSFSPLSISSTSRYFKTIFRSNKIDEWSNYKLANLLPLNYFDKLDRFNILFYGNNHINPLWNNVKINEKFYLNNSYTYQLLSTGTLVNYNEFYNGEMIKCLQFDKQEVYWQILIMCNHKVTSLDELSVGASQVNSDEIKLCLKVLNDEWLLYSKDDYSENITIINTDLIL